MSKPDSVKYYVVWVGRIPGVYTNWPKAQEQIKGFPQAKFKSFKSREEAESAFRGTWQDYYEDNLGMGGGSKVKPRLDDFLDEIVANSLAVDAACSGNPGKMEYRGVWTLGTDMEVFHSPVFPVGTNNIGEFLALVHALALFHKEKPDLAIYSDSRNAINWIKQKKCKSKLVENQRTAKLWEVVRRGEKWLQSNKWSNPILKWKTDRWGEIPADFGRK